MIKTLEEEIPVTKDGLHIYIKGIQKELETKEPIVKHLRLALKKAQERLEKMR